MKYDFDSKSVVVTSKEEQVSSDWRKKGIIYARVSTEEQKRKGGWIIGQTIDCEKRAEREGVDVVKYFKDEAITWADLTRKSFLDAISFIEKENKKGNEIDYFICWATSRFSRSPKINKSFDMVLRVESAGAKLVAVWNGWIQETESEEWLISLTLNFLVDALESKRWSKRVRYWQKWKIYEGLWPFADVPVGYERIKETIGGKEINFLIKKEPDATILAEGLQLFAEWVLLTKQQLYEFFKEKWLKSNSKKNKSWKLHTSMIDHILDLWKLLVYSGHLTYPNWGIHEIIPAKHPAIISVDTMHKIQMRLENDYWTLNHTKRKYDQDADLYPLKRILLCPECHKWVTKWKSLSKTGDYHHYYGCNKRWCKLHKKSLRRDDVHDAVRAKLLEIQPPAIALKLFEKVFIEEREKLKVDNKDVKKVKKQKITLIKWEMDRIEKALDRLSDTENPNIKLLNKKQERRADLNQEIEELELEVENVSYDQEEMKKVFDEAKTVIANPIALRDLDDLEIKQLLIRVCFNNKIYYTKNQGLHTPDISVIYLALSGLSNDDSCNVKVRGIEPLSECHDEWRLLS